MALRVASGDRECSGFSGAAPRVTVKILAGRDRTMVCMPRLRLGPRTRTLNLSKVSLKPIPSPTAEQSGFKVEVSTQTEMIRAASPQVCEYH